MTAMDIMTDDTMDELDVPRGRNSVSRPSHKVIEASNGHHISIVRRVRLLCLMAALIFGAWSASLGAEVARGGSADAGSQVSSVAFGVKITLQMPRSTYPQNALARAVTIVQNVSSHPVSIRRPLDGCWTNPTVITTSADGKTVYPAGLTTVFPHPCKVPIIRQLAPGQIIRATRYLVVRGPIIRGLVFVGAGVASQLATPAFPVRLTEGTAPQVAIRSTPNGPYAQISPVLAAHGAVRFISSAECGSSGSGGVVDVLRWTMVHSFRVEAGCPGTEEWHAVVGWVNEPVAEIDYNAVNR
jgi:hypothetical protein